MIAEILAWVVELVELLGYWGIFIATFLESTFVPLPSEVTVIPVGYLVSQGKMNLWLAFLCSFLGTISGSYFSYWIAERFGRRILVRYARYFFMDEEKLEKVESYFARHGAVSIFTGRLIPGIRHFISFPAGLARMNLKLFFLYTGLGGGLWMAVLIWAGHAIGTNQERLHEYMPLITWGVFGSALVLLAAYAIRQKCKAKRP